MFLQPKGRDWGTVVNWDSLGKAYAATIIIWTSLLLLGIAWLVYQRQQPFVRIRNLPLAVTSTGFLHIYLVKIFLAYTTNGHFLCSAEYWVMCIYLPFGIALFQAYLAQLRGIWDKQQNLISRTSSTSTGQCDIKKVSIVARWRNLSGLHKTYIFIGVGMVVQVSSPLLKNSLTHTTPAHHHRGIICRDTNIARRLVQLQKGDPCQRSSTLPEIAPLDSFCILAAILDLVLWSIHHLPDSLNPRHAFVEDSSRHQCHRRNTRVSVMARGALLAKVQASEHEMGPSNVAGSRNHGYAIRDDFLPDD